MELSLLVRPFSPKIKSLKYDIIDKKGIIKILVERNDKLVFSDIRMDTIIQQQKAVIETFAPLGEQSSRGDVQKTHLMGEETEEEDGLHPLPADGVADGGATSLHADRESNSCFTPEFIDCR